LIRYTRHAQDQMRQGLISRQEVEAVLTAPDQRLPGRSGRRKALKRVQGRFLCVVYAVAGLDQWVITTYGLEKEQR
jgi:uncharacterized protein DUF4258